MGCYGIGLGRLMAAIVEINHDKNGIIWPKEVSLFLVHLIQIGDDEKIKRASEEIYQNLQKNEIEVLYDDREKKRGGEKLVEADLIGIPLRILLSEKSLSVGNVEIKKRNEEKVGFKKKEELVNYLKNKF